MDEKNEIGHEGELARLLRRILEQFGYEEVSPRDDALDTGRWDISLFGIISVLRDALHSLNTKTEVLAGRLEVFERKLDISVELSDEIADSLDGLKEIARELGDKSHEIKVLVSEVVPEQPLLLRNLVSIDTNATEIMLFMVTAGECAFFAVGNELLVRSALFQGISSITNVPAIWGIIAGLLSLSSIVAFLTRRRILRAAAAWSNALYFTVTGVLPLFYAGAVLGSLHHCIFGLCAVWVLIRGPGRAI